MKDEFIGIKEFAELIGYNRTSIYKILDKVDNQLSPYCRKVGGKLKINKRAVFEVFSVEVKETEATPIDTSRQEATEKAMSTEVLNKNEASSKENVSDLKENASVLKQIEVDLLYKHIEMLEKTNAEKDKQIEALNINLTKALDNLDQQQKLSVIDKQKILELEAYKEEEENKTFWQRLFGIKKNKLQN